jgi:bla regulator protein blaR1
MAFEVASVRQSKPGSRPPMPNFPLDNGDAFKNPRSGESPHGRFSAAFPLSVHITFAYKLGSDQAQTMMAHLPKWARTDSVEIVAKAPGDPAKDQMRLMMQSLLAERFHLAAHYETTDIPVFALTPIKPGKWGPNLIRHADGPSCDASTPAGASVAGDSDAELFPRVCDVQALVMRNGRMVAGSRNTTMALLAASLSGLGRLDRPVVDRSGFADRIDYRLEWVRESNDPGTRRGCSAGSISVDIRRRAARATGPETRIHEGFRSSR